MSDSSLVSCLSEASGVKFSWVEVLLGRSQIFLEKYGKHRPIEGLEVMWFVHRAGSFSEVPGSLRGVRPVLLSSSEVVRRHCAPGSR